MDETIAMVPATRPVRVSRVRTDRVEVSFTQPMAILGAFGLRDMTIRGTGEAQGVRGVDQEVQ